MQQAFEIDWPEREPDLPRFDVVLSYNVLKALQRMGAW